MKISSNFLQKINTFFYLKFYFHNQLKLVFLNNYSPKDQLPINFTNYCQMPNQGLILCTSDFITSFVKVVLTIASTLTIILEINV